jgi:hypothetical protein
MFDPLLQIFEISILYIYNLVEYIENYRMYTDHFSVQHQGDIGKIHGH